LKTISRSDVVTGIQRFVRWLDAFGETSYDHQSYYAGALGGRAKRLYYEHPRLGVLAVAPMIASEALFPVGRQLFWKKQRFPIADAHYAMGFALLAERDGSSAHHARAVHFLEVLEQTRCPGYRHAGWGYPFDWVTRNGVMKAETPLITTTPYVYEAFAAVHRLDGDPRWLRTMESAAEHGFSDIPDLALADDEATCAYNPHDTQYRVVNASAYRAFLLFSAAAQFGRDDYRWVAQRNLNYVLRAQRPDGSWTYATDGIRDFVDHFHTCFVLKALAKIEPIAPSEGLHTAIARGVQYYAQHLFDDDGLPRPFAVAPRLTVYRHELYDYAECINLATLLRGRFPLLDERLATTLADLFNRWRKDDGSFRSRELMLGWDNVPMHRWAQSQLFRALAQWLSIDSDAQRSGGASGALHARIGSEPVAAT
jgi:hypothetical protein